MVIHETRVGGQENSRFAVHYLTYQDFEQDCRRAQPDFTRCWAFEDKSDWSLRHIKQATTQCYHYSTNFFNGDVNNRTRKYISIITDSRKYRLWYAFWNGKEVNVEVTTDYDWSRDPLSILSILARVFKTFTT